jgi:hypothetical protein
MYFYIYQKYTKVFHLRQRGVTFRIHITIYLEIGLKCEYLDVIEFNIFSQFQFHLRML